MGESQGSGMKKAHLGYGREGLRGFHLCRSTTCSFSRQLCTVWTIRVLSAFYRQEWKGN